jgi:hypothetical protein
MINIPSTVKIAGVTYNVKREEKPFIGNNAIVDGTFDYVEQELRIARTGSETYQQIVFLHEVLHGLIESYCSNLLSFETEEKLVEQLSKGLFQFIADNPGVFVDMIPLVSLDKVKLK